MFLVPIIPVVMLLGSSTSFPACLAAAILFGLAAGAETDVISYVIATRMPDVFGTAFAVCISFAGVCASLGPLVAGRLYDLYGSYRIYLLSIIPVVTLGALLICSLPGQSPHSRATR